MTQQPVLDSFMAYREAGRGEPIVLLHGNPTSSFVWRDVIPMLSESHRVLAPDLIGMGDSGKPALDYRFVDHRRYLDAFLATLPAPITLVGYDWGGVLALDWAARHPERVRAVVVFETFLRPMTWSDWPPQGAELFKAYRTPEVGEAMVLERNEFLPRSLEFGVKTGLSESERATYYAPYPTPESRLPLLQWPREIPIDGEPADVHAIVENNVRFLREDQRVPKLLLAFEGSGMSAPPVLAFARETTLRVQQLGPAGHHAPEDVPREIADAISAFLAH